MTDDDLFWHSVYTNSIREWVRAIMPYIDNDVDDLCFDNDVDDSDMKMFNWKAGH